MMWSIHRSIVMTWSIHLLWYNNIFFRVKYDFRLYKKQKFWKTSLQKKFCLKKVP